MSSRFDLIVRNGSVVTPDGVAPADVGVAGGKIVAVQDRIRESAPREIDAAGLHVFPAVLDAHVHFNEPGRTEWEGLASGSSALAAGGGGRGCGRAPGPPPPAVGGAGAPAARRPPGQETGEQFFLFGGL